MPGWSRAGSTTKGFAASHSCQREPRPRYLRERVQSESPALTSMAWEEPSEGRRGGESRSTGAGGFGRKAPAVAEGSTGECAPAKNSAPRVSGAPGCLRSSGSNSSGRSEPAEIAGSGVFRAGRGTTTGRIPETGGNKKAFFVPNGDSRAGEFSAGTRFTGGAARRFLRGSEPRRGRENGSRRSTAPGGSGSR
jgi:hypothetical protein